MARTLERFGLVSDEFWIREVYEVYYDHAEFHYNRMLNEQ
jgi:hypothetical protein